MREHFHISDYNRVVTIRDSGAILGAINISSPIKSTEKLSHGEPTFFVKNKVFVMFADNHHNDGHIAVWLPVPSGFQNTLIETAPETFFKPPYVGVRGWVGIELDRITDKDLTYHIQVAWELIAPKRLLASVKAKDTPKIKQK